MTISKSEYWVIIVCLSLVIYLLFKHSFSSRILISVAAGAALALVCAFVVKKISRSRGSGAERS